MELYILLLRFSSLVGETIPEHQDYRASSPKERADYTQRLKRVLSELEKLKPEVFKQVEKLNYAFTDNSIHENNAAGMYEWPPVAKGPLLQNLHDEKDRLPHMSNKASQNIQTELYEIDNQLNNLSLSLRPPKNETLSRHSFLGPNGLRARWDAPVSQARVQYPSYVDSTPMEIPSLEQKWSKTLADVEVPNATVTLAESTSLEVCDAGQVDIAAQLSLIRQPSPPPVAAPVEQLPSMFEMTETSKLAQPPPPSRVADPFPGPPSTLAKDLKQNEGPKHLHISTKMMDDFLKVARQNTNNNIETCGVLAGSLKNAIFYVTVLIIPKQEATSDSCQTLNEEEIFEFQDKRGLFQLGWIHTHPTQTCFMSSVDLHTHYSYQVMLPEAIAVVMAPTDDTRKFGIFQLSQPAGVKVIQNCQMRGFHTHEQPSDGSPIYAHSRHVLMNSTLRYRVIDLR